MIDKLAPKTRNKQDQHVVSALRKVGVKVSSVYDLVNTQKAYPEAIPVLIHMLPTVDEDTIKEGIVRALTVKEARGIAAKPLIAEFKKILPQEHPTKQLLKWAIGNALSVLADDSVFEEIVGLVRDKRHGKAREMLTVALGNMKNPTAVKVLTELLRDDEVAGHAIIALGKLRAKSSRPAIEPFLTHSKSWVRQEARRALAKIDKAQNK